MNTSNKFSMNQWRKFITEDSTPASLKENKSVVKVKDLTFDMVKDIFTNKYQEEQGTREQPDGTEGPMYKDYVSFNKGEGSSQGILDAKALEQWKNYILSIKDIDPNIEVTLDPNAVWYNKASFSDPVFKERERKLVQAMSSYYDSKKPGEYTGD